MIGWDDKDAWMGENHQPVPFFVLSQVTLSYFSGTNMNDLRKTSLHPCGYKDVPKWVRVYLDVHRSQWILTTEACSPEAWNTGERRFFSWPYFRSVDSTTNADLPYGTQKRMWLYCPKGMTILENQPDGGLQIRNSESRPVQTLDDFGWFWPNFNVGLLKSYWNPHVCWQCPYPLVI